MKTNATTRDEYIYVEDPGSAVNETKPDHQFTIFLVLKYLRGYFVKPHDALTHRLMNNRDHPKSNPVCEMYLVCFLHRDERNPDT